MIVMPTRTYRNHTLDSTRWERFTPRPDDIVISTSYRSGTTWTQEIILHLVFLGRTIPYRNEATLWLDSRFEPLDEVLRRLEQQQHRRFIKTHLAYDGLPYYPQVRYLIISRDPRDVFMSLWNFYSNFTGEFFHFVNTLPDREGEPLPPAPADIHSFWQLWINRGWFSWEQEGYPFWGNMHHIRTWWEQRHRANVLLVHFTELLHDTTGQIRRMADFLDIPASDEQITQIAQQTSLTAMRTRAEQNEPNMQQTWKEGARTFFYRGMNGRWRDVLSTEELEQYDVAATAVLAPDCRAWLERE